MEVRLDLGTAFSLLGEHERRGPLSARSAAPGRYPRRPASTRARAVLRSELSVPAGRARAGDRLRSTRSGGGRGAGDFALENRDRHVCRPGPSAPRRLPARYRDLRRHRRRADRPPGERPPGRALPPFRCSRVATSWSPWRRRDGSTRAAGRPTRPSARGGARSPGYRGSGLTTGAGVHHLGRGEDARRPRRTHSSEHTRCAESMTCPCIARASAQSVVSRGPWAGCAREAVPMVQRAAEEAAGRRRDEPAS